MAAVRLEDLFVKVIFCWLILAAMVTSGPGRVNVFVDANSKSQNKTSNQWWISGGTGSSNEHGFGDVNISAILNSFQMGYDKRVRPNYGGKWLVRRNSNHFHCVTSRNGPQFTASFRILKIISTISL